MSISTIATSGVDLEDRDRLAAGASRSAPSCRGAPARCSARRCCARRRRPPAPCVRRRSSSELCSRSSMRCFSGGRSATTRCRNSAVSSSSRSGDSTPLTTTLRAMRVQLRVLLGRQLAAGEDDDRQVATAPGRPRICSSTSKPDMSGSRRSSTTQSAGLVRAAIASASAPVPTVTMSMSSWPSSSRDAQLLRRIVLDHQQPLAARLGVLLDPVEHALRGPRSSPAW